MAFGTIEPKINIYDMPYFQELFYRNYESKENFWVLSDVSLFSVYVSLFIRAPTMTLQIVFGQ